MDFDSLPDDPQPAAMPAIKTPATEAAGQSFDSLQDDSEKYGTTGQQALAGIEGAGRGLLTSPVASAIETGLGASPQAILARQKVNPATAGIGEAAGLGLGMLTDTGEAALLSDLGRTAKSAAGLGELAEGASLGHKIGASAVQQAAEMAVMTGSDEVGKMLLQDPDTSAESAVINTGLGAVLGGTAGAAVTGVVSPLWKATIGPKVEELLNGITRKVNGESLIKPPDSIIEDLKKLNITPTPLQSADLSESPTANEWSRNLKRSENRKYLDEQQALKESVANSVIEPLGSNIEDLRVYDNDTAGRTIGDKINTQIKDTFEPLWEGMDKRKAEASGLTTDDNSKLGLMDKLREKGVITYAPNSPHADIFYQAGERQLDFTTLADYDKYDSELRGLMKKAFRSGDSEEGLAYQSVRGMIKDYKNEMIEKAAMESEKAGMEGAAKLGEDWIAERKALNQRYANAENVREELGEHFNISSDNSRQFIKQLNENMTPEQILKKFSIKNNMDGARFLQENFPAAFQEVVKNERRALLKPAINAAKDEMPIDVNRLNKIIDTAKAGKDSYLNTILPPEFLDRAESGARVLSQMTNPRDSGTPAGLWGMLRHLGGSALGMVGMLSGHGIGAGLVLGELGARLGKDVPEAAKLAMLRFAASSEPVSAPGMKALVDFIDQTRKGQNLITRAVKNTLKSGAMVIASNNMPAQADRDKLEKAMTKAQKQPEVFAHSQAGDLGHYLPPHQASVATVSSRAIQYLSTLRPQSETLGPLDKPMPPTPMQEARYNRAMNIAINPLIVLNNVKQGSLQTTDIQDLNAMYPGVYKQISQELTNEMTSATSRNETVPYKTRMALSLFLGQPLDASMTPQSIQAAQGAMQPMPPPTPQGKPKKLSQAAGKGLKKASDAYKTTTQAAEADRSSRD